MTFLGIDRTLHPSLDEINFLQAGTGAVQRDAQSKMRDIVNVVDFGAVVDGVTDDYTVLAAAQTRLVALGGGVLELPPGTLAIGSQFVIAAGVTVRGAGRGATTIKWIGSNSLNVVTINNPQPDNTPIYSGIVDLTIDTGTATGMQGLLLLDTKRATVDVRIKSSVTASGVGLRLQAGNGGTGENYNTAFNRLDVEIFGFQFAYSANGTAAGNVVTDNYFTRLTVDGPGSVGVRYTEYADNNYIEFCYINLRTNNTYGVIQNDSATPGSNVGVYANNFGALLIDAFSLTGCTGILLNFQKQFVVQAFFHSPEVFDATLISDNSGRSISHYIVNCQRSESENSIEIVQKGMWRAAAAAKNGAGTSFGAGPTDVPFATEVFDVTGSFATPTFTAPVTDKYLCILNLNHTSGVTLDDEWVIKLVTTAREWVWTYHVGAAKQNSISYSAVADMAAGATAKWTITQLAGAGSLPLTANADVNFASFTGLGIS